MGVSDARLAVLTLLCGAGSARWSDFERLGLPKATVYKALRGLVEEGLVERRGRLYVLAADRHVVLARFVYAPLLCRAVPGCAEWEVLGDDLLRSVGSDISRVEDMYRAFVDKRIRGEGADGIIDAVLRSLYLDRGFFAVVVAELAAVFLIKTLVDRGCNVFADLGAGLAERLGRALREGAEGFARTFGARVEDVIETLLKLRATLEKHGYRGELAVKLLSTRSRASIAEIIELTQHLLRDVITSNATARCFTALLDIAKNLAASGCRNLGTLEKKKLYDSCT